MQIIMIPPRVFSVKMTKDGVWNLTFGDDLSLKGKSCYKKSCKKAWFYEKSCNFAD